MSVRPDTAALAAMGTNISTLCELATDLLDGVNLKTDYRLAQLSALLYLMKDRTEHLANEIDRLN